MLGFVVLEPPPDTTEERRVATDSFVVGQGRLVLDKQVQALDIVAEVHGIVAEVLDIGAEVLDSFVEVLGSFVELELDNCNHRLLILSLTRLMQKNLMMTMMNLQKDFQVHDVHHRSCDHRRIRDRHLLQGFHRCLRTSSRHLQSSRRLC